MNVEIKGLDQLRARLRAVMAEAKVEMSEDIEVGFSVNYAIAVHERVYSGGGGRNAKGQFTRGRKVEHKPPTQAKFLEATFQNKKAEIWYIIRATAKASKSMLLALLKAGLYVQAEAQKITPVDTGALRASAYTRKIPKT